MAVLFLALFNIPTSKANDIYSLNVYKSSFGYMGAATLAKSVFGFLITYANGKKHFVKEFHPYGSGDLKITILAFSEAFVYASILSISQ